MTCVIGIDPGSRITGYGVVIQEKNNVRYVAHGQIHTHGTDHGQKLYQIFQNLSEVIKLYEPKEAAIEQVFMQKNVQSALKLGQARGAAMIAMAQYGLNIAEYSPRQIKQAVVGYGAANKIQVQHMIRALLRMTETPPSDAADALAIALCHCNHQHFSSKLVALKNKE